MPCGGDHTPEPPPVAPTSQGARDPRDRPWPLLPSPPGAAHNHPPPPAQPELPPPPPPSRPDVQSLTLVATEVLFTLICDYLFTTI